MQGRAVNTVAHFLPVLVENDTLPSGSAEPKTKVSIVEAEELG